MKPIIQLDKSLINKIAAGEVVERPLNVVKELTENAIDAGATILTIEITDGGLTMIRITDNGSGIAKKDLPLAFARHATSKIANIDDLFTVQTLGFRGEALSSIAAVSKVELITKTQSDIEGTRIEIHGGEMVKSQAIGCAVGTSIIVNQLFYNTPARRKFLKKPASEAGLVSECVQRLALGNPNLSIKYISNNQVVFQTNGSGDLKNTILNCYSRDIASNLVAVDATEENMVLTGFVGKPSIARSNRNYGNFFINGRLIQSQILRRAVESAMRTMIGAGRFPLYVLNLNMPFDDIDVNVHPTKLDVRFAHESNVFDFIEHSISHALLENDLVPKKIEPRREIIKKYPTIEPIIKPRQIDLHPFSVQNAYLVKQKEQLLASKGHDDVIAEPQKTYTHINTHLPEPPYMPETSDKPRTNELSNSVLLYETTLEQHDFTDYKILGLAFNTYWLIEKETSIYLLDQHAAHERVLYETIKQQVMSKSIPSQRLMFPLEVSLTPHEMHVLTENLQIFQDFGFEFDNEDAMRILAVPLLYKGPVDSLFFMELLDKLEDTGFKDNHVYEHKLNMLFMTACKAAVKAGDKLSTEEAHALIKQLLELDNPFTCPHGRPTLIEISQREIERRFARS